MFLTALISCCNTHIFWIVGTAVYFYYFFLHRHPINNNVYSLRFFDVKEILPSSLPLLFVQVSDAFAKLPKAIISFVMSVRLSACLSVRPFDWPHGITQLPLEGFNWILYFSFFVFRKSVYRFQVSLKSDKNGGGLCTCVTISLWILLIMRNISDKSSGENWSTFYVR